MSGVKGESSCVIVYILNVKRYLLLDIVNSMLYWSSIIINVHTFSNKSMYKTSQWYKPLHNSVIISYIEWFTILPWSCGSSSNFCIHPQLFLIAVTEAIIQHFFTRNAILIQKYISIYFLSDDHESDNVMVWQSYIYLSLTLIFFPLISPSNIANIN